MENEGSQRAALVGSPSYSSEYTGARLQGFWLRNRGSAEEGLNGPSNARRRFRATKQVLTWLFPAIWGLVAQASAPPTDTVTEFSADVLPRAWISGNGESSRLNALTDDAVIFPSLTQGESGSSSVIFAPPTPFFRPSNHFPRQATFVWPYREAKLFAIEVQRGPGSSNVTFSLSKQDLTEIRRLPWTQFRAVQRAFENWLLDRSGFCFFCNRRARFNALEETLLILWRDRILQDAGFSAFAALHLKVPTPFPVSYQGTNSDINNKIQMSATQVSAREELLITWGSTTFYPFVPTDGTTPKPGLLGGYTRPSVGGQTALSVTESEGSPDLFPRETARLGDVPIDSRTVNALYPFPSQWIPLVGTLFIPIYNPLDLLHVNLLRSVTVAKPIDSQGKRLKVRAAANLPRPRFLFLLSPTEYVKPEASGGGTTDDAEFTTDARTDSGETPAVAVLQLEHRFVLIGCDAATVKCVEDELTRVLDAAAHELNPTYPSPVTNSGYVIGLFMNQTAVEIHRHVTINSHPLYAPQRPGETWGDVVLTWMPALLARSRGDESRPPLEIHRYVSFGNGASLRSLGLRFHAVIRDVLDQVRVGEGDEFNAAGLSEVLRP